jgi:hypothetical protein
MRLLLVAALALSACASTRVAPASPLAQPGAVLTYDVVAGPQTYPFEVTVRQNDEAGTAFAFDLGGGTAQGVVSMTPGAREAAARGMMNQFQTRDYTLDEQTSVWMARDDVRRLKAGETVAITVDGQSPTAFTLDGCATTAVVLDGVSTDLPTCRYTGAGGRFVVAVDNEQDPLILDMNAGTFRVTLQDATR